MSETPLYPLTVKFSTGEVETFANEQEVCFNLEWIDSDDVEDPIEVTDAHGRRVRLQVVALQIITLALL